MPCRLKFLFVSLALFFLVYLEERFLLFNFKQSSQHLHSDYLRKKNPETKLQMEPLFEKFQKRYWQRFSRVKTVCERYHLGTEVKPTSVSNSEEEEYQRLERDASLAPEKTIMHLAKFSLLYCWVHKAASSSWNKIFFQLVGKTKVKEHNLHEAAAFFRPPAHQLSSLITSSLVFVVVRHPFERLVSAFRLATRRTTSTSCTLGPSSR